MPCLMEIQHDIYPYLEGTKIIHHLLNGDNRQTLLNEKKDIVILLANKTLQPEKVSLELMLTGKEYL